MNTLETIRKGEVCNTNKTSPPQPNQLKNWFFTFNNYTEADIEILETKFKKICKKYLFQKEIGHNNKIPHLQGNITLWNEMRWTEFNLSPKIHWEKTKNVKAAYIYCSKDFTRVGTEIFTNIKIEAPIVKYVENIEDFFHWEISIKDFLFNNEPDNRSIYWFWGKDGCAGKTIFQKYLYTHLEDIVILGGKAGDMKNGIIEYHKGSKRTPKIVLFNLPKSTGKIDYGGIEEVKDMFFFSGKYEGGMICGASPHLMIFSNEEPSRHKMSMDRWKIFNIEENVPLIL